MAAKNLIGPIRLFTDEPMEGTLTSQAIDIKYVDNVSIQSVITGTPQAGDLQMEVSNDHSLNPDGSVRNAGNWEVVPNMDVQVTAGVPAQVVMNATQLASAFVRLRYLNEHVQDALITTVADVAGSLNDTYFLLSASGVDYYVWFNVDSGGTDPALPGRTGVEVAIVEDDTADDVAAALEPAVEAIPGIASSVSTDEVTLTWADNDNAAQLEDGAVPTGFTFALDGGDGTLSAYLVAKGI
jgi:hypothetical protein